MAGAVDSETLTIIRALIDFIYYAQLQLHTSKTLNALDSCLKTFHTHKELLIKLGIHEHFNIPKLHAILHYLQAIRALGSVDGYNTESPERLHIEFAKDGYRASNKRDYLEQMALWLQRREAMWMKEAYLMGLEEKLKRVGSDETVEDEIELVDVDFDVDVDVEQTTNVNNTNPTSTTHTLLTPYSIAKNAPYPDTTVNRLASYFGAIDFIPALSVFIHENLPHCNIEPSPFDRFDVFKQILIPSPANKYLSNQPRTSRIRTTPAIKPKGRKPGTPARFDTALIAEDISKHHRFGGLEGMQN